MLIYDFEQELSYWEEKDGTRYRVSALGSFISVCPICGEQQFQDTFRLGECLQGHGKMVHLTAANQPHYRRLWTASGVKLTSPEQRRRVRIQGGREFGQK